MSGTPHKVFQRLRTRLQLRQQPWRGAFGGSELPEASVLIALTDETEPRVLLGRRGLHLSHHPGEVAFAGGKREPEDASPWITAMREAEEEVGIAPADVVPLGELDPLITRTGFIIHPCVAQIPARVQLVVDHAEFDSVLMPQFATFADERIFRLETMYDGTHMRKVPHFQVGPDNVWGATAAILALLANVAYDAGFDLERNWKEKP